MRTQLLLATSIRSVPAPIWCRLCSVHTVEDKDERCRSCTQRLANIAAVENDQSFKRIVAYGVLGVLLIVAIYSLKILVEAI